MSKIKAYYIKESCPIFSKDYINVKPYIYTNIIVAEQSLEDYKEIDAIRVMCGEFEIVEIEIEENKINNKYKIKDIKDYEDDKKYDIHGYNFLKMIGRER